MGFSQVVAFILLFFALIMVMTTLSMFYVKSMEDIGAAAEQKKQNDATIGSSSIKINSTTYRTRAGLDELEIEVINDGSVKLDLEHIDVFINKTRIPRNDINRTITYYSDSKLINPLHFDPGERVKIEVYMNQTSGSANILTITTEFGANAIFSYSVP